MLAAAGYDVLTADGGEPALAMVVARSPDLILLDVRMPGLDGFDVLRKLKGTAEIRNIPVLTISAFAEADERIEGLKLGAVDSVTKPFHAGELLARVRMQLELSTLRAQHASHTTVLKSANEELQREMARREQTEEELRKGESRLNFALETLSAGAWDLDLVDHSAHRTLLHDRIFGYQTLLPDWTYEKFLEHVLPEDRTDVDRCFREATESCCDWGFECRIRRADGEVRWIWATGSHERNAEGKPVRMSGIVQDITDRRAVEAALRENETNLTLTLQSIGDAVIATDIGGRITRMNPVAERLTGWPFAEAEGRPMEEVFRIVNARTREPAEDPVGRVIASGLTVGLANHTLLLARDSREYQIADSAAPIRDPYGVLLGVVLVFRDVTERYEAEAKIARLSRLYAALSQCNQAIVHSSSLEELLPKICRDVVEFGGLRMAWIGLVDEASGLVRPAASYGEAREYVEGIQISTNVDEATGRGPVGTSIRENQPAWCQDFQHDPNTAPWHERGARYGWASCAALPLRRRGKTIGALAVYSDKADAFDEEVRKLLVDMADDISFAIDSFSGDAERRRTEQALLQKGNEYERLLEHLSAGVVVHSHDSAIVLANTMASSLLGLTKAQMLGKTAMDPAWCFLREDGTLTPLAEYPVQRVLTSGEPIRSQVFGISRPDIAAPTWVLCNAYPEHDEAGQISQVVVSFIDITERKTTEGRVARLTHLYAALSQCNQTIVHAASIEELLPKICRDVVEFGGMQMAWIGMVDEVRALIRPAASFGSGADYLDGIAIPFQGDDPRGRGPAGTAIRENRPVWCQDFQNDPTTALWHEHGARYGWAAYAALPLSKRGKVMGVIVVYSDKANAFDEEVRKLLQEMADDISFALDGFASEAERKKTEAALKESEERFRLMLQHIPSISVQGYHMDGTTHYWNDASEVIYGYSAEEALGRNLLDLIIPPEMKDGVRLAIKAMAETLQPVPASELTLVRKDGSRVTVYSSHAVVNRPGREPEFFCLDIDLTDRKLAEESLKELNAYLEEAKVRAEELAVKAESAARAKSEFLALMSHELRTPLNGVLGFAELLSRTRLDEEQQEYTKTIFDSGSHLLDVVNDILDLSSLEKGQMQIEAARIVVSSLVESSCRPIRKLAADKGLEFSYASAPDIPEVIMGDIRRIRQILINLLGNAVKFTQKGSVVLQVSTASLEGRPALDFSVEDTGPGIPNETLADLFKPFTQADSTVSRQFEGTGLGLAISLRLAEAMGGTLDVVSAPGQGSRFTFRFPMDATSPPQPAGGSAAGTAAGRVFANTVGVALAADRAPIFVVEDDPTNRMLACKMIEHLGLRSEIATNGLEAVEAFAPGKFSAILMDMQMPLMDGLEATRKIREIESGNRVPIIALTANVMPGDRERCLAAGMDEFLTKPFNLKELSDKLARFLPA